MKTEIVKRTFEAEKFPAGSTERRKLNENPVTSEYMHSIKQLAMIHVPETRTSRNYTMTKGTRTRTEAQDWINSEIPRYEKLITKQNAGVSKIVLIF